MLKESMSGFLKRRDEIMSDSDYNELVNKILKLYEEKLKELLQSDFFETKITLKSGYTYSLKKDKTSANKNEHSVRFCLFKNDTEYSINHADCIGYVLDILENWDEICSILQRNMLCAISRKNKIANRCRNVLNKHNKG